MRVLITGTRSGEGVTTAAVNLALMFAETGRPVSYIDCDLDKRTGYDLLDPEPEMDGGALCPVESEQSGPVSGLLIKGNAWGIDCHSVCSAGLENGMKKQALSQLLSIRAQGVTVIDMPHSPEQYEMFLQGDADVIIAVTSPDSFESGNGLEKLHVYDCGSDRFFVIINKCMKNIPWTGNPVSQEGFEILCRLRYDPNIKRAAEKGCAALEQIPRYRPFFRKLAENIMKEEQTTPVPAYIKARYAPAVG